MENSFKSFLDNSESVLILLPKNPFFDQVAAGLSLYLALENNLPAQTGKTVSISSSADMTVEFNRLVGVNKISQEVGNKNLVIKFKNYQAQNIERVTYDIEDNEFRLSVIPKPQVAPPTEDQLKVGYSGLSADTVILVGGGSESHFPILSKPELKSAKKAHIGLSSLTSENKEILSFAKTSSSTAEIMFEYIKELGLEINADIASNLLSGLNEGSKNFSSHYVTANTFQVASELMQLGAVNATQEKPQKTYTAQDFGHEEHKKPQSPIASMNDIDTDTDTPKSWLEPKIYKGTVEN